MTVGHWRAASRLMQSTASDPPPISLSLSLSGWPVFTSSRSRSSLCWEHCCCRGTVTGSALEEQRGIFSLLCVLVCVSTCVHAHFFVFVCVCVDLDFLCAVVRGSGDGGEMTLDPDHMSGLLITHTSACRASLLLPLGLRNLPAHHHCMHHHHHHPHFICFICIVAQFSINFLLNLYI